MNWGWFWWLRKGTKTVVQSLNPTSTCHDPAIPWPNSKETRRRTLPCRNLPPMPWTGQPLARFDGVYSERGDLNQTRPFVAGSVTPCDYGVDEQPTFRFSHLQSGYKSPKSWIFWEEKSDGEEGAKTRELCVSAAPSSPTDLKLEEGRRESGKYSDSIFSVLKKRAMKKHILWGFTERHTHKRISSRAKPYPSGHWIHISNAIAESL